MRIGGRTLYFTEGPGRTSRSPRTAQEKNSSIYLPIFHPEWKFASIPVTLYPGRLTV